MWTGPSGPPRAPSLPAPASRPPPAGCSQRWYPQSWPPVAEPGDQNVEQTDGPTTVIKYSLDCFKCNPFSWILKLFTNKN